MPITAQDTALITGASSGIGWELARCFAAAGHNVVLTARNEAKLHKLADELTAKHKITATRIVADLARPDAPRELYDQLKRDGVDVGVLVNNAGFGNNGRLMDHDVQGELNLVQVNVHAALHLARLFGADMVTRGRGGILNVASVAAYQPGPLMANYYASKAYLLSLSEAMWFELSKCGVAVTALCPGPTETAFFERAGAGQPRSAVRCVTGAMSPGRVAQAGYQGLIAGRRVVIPGLSNQLMALAAKVAPRALSARLARTFNERFQ
jgi:short-subunit dehydrogenase